MFKDAAGPEVAILDVGVEDIHAGLGDGALGCVIDDKGNRQVEREVEHVVGGALMEIKCGGTQDVGHCEGRTGVVAGRDLCEGGVDKHAKVPVTLPVTVRLVACAGPSSAVTGW